MPDFSFEQKYWALGRTIIGIDEVGRGCLAGPITLGACVMRKRNTEDQTTLLKLGVNDSKKLSPLKREHIVDAFGSCGVATYTSSIGVDVINDAGIMNAWRKGIVSLVSMVQTEYPSDHIILLVDGTPVKDIPYKEPVESLSIVKGDTKSFSIAAASIVAKVTRDRYMTKSEELYPVYQWGKNKGYGTKSHCEAIKEHGISPFHRTLFVRSLTEKH